MIAKVLTPEGKKVTFSQETDNPEAWLKSLEKKGFIVLSQSESSNRFAFLKNSGLGKRKENFLTQLSVLLGAGLNLQKALSILAKSLKVQSDRDRIEKILLDLKEGSPFSRALGGSGLFSSTEILFLRAGEEAGEFKEMLDLLGNSIKTENNFRRQLGTLFLYPMLLVLMSFSLLTFLIFRVLPEIVSVFKEIGNKPPPLTQAVIDIQDFVSTNYLWLIPLIVGMIALVMFWAKRNLPFLQHQVLKLPLLGNLYRRSVLLNFLPPFTLLLRKKISPEKIASTLKHSFSKQSLVVEILGAFESGLKKGERLTKPLLESPLFETGETELLIIAEESSRVPEILEKILDQLRREQEDELKRLVTLLEPAIILFIGTIVLFFVLNFLLPLIGADLGGE